MTDATACHYAGKHRPRMLRTHQRDCESSACHGCVECPERHCRVCEKRHVTVDGRGVDETCTSCLSDVRTGIAEIVDMATRMLGEAIMRGINSEAAHLEGPVASPAAWQQRGTYGHRYEPDSRLGDNHPLWVLGGWDLRVGRHLGHHRPGRLTLTDTAAYLNQHLTDLAHDGDFPFDELAEAVRDCHTHVEDTLYEGEKPDRGAPCPMCGRANLELDHGDAVDGSDDRWRCSRRACGAAYTEDDYRAKVEAVYVTHADRLTASQIATTYRVPEGTVRRWASGSNPTVRTRGKDSAGRQLYDVADVLAQRDRRNTA